MKNSVKLFLAGTFLLGLAVATVAQAANLDVVRDSRGAMVCTKGADCVRSMWTNSYDECQGMALGTKTVYFGFGRSALSAQGKKMLNVLASNIKARGDDVVGVRIIGFADRIGNAAANEKLSKRRADRVRRYLVSKGIMNAQVLETRWFGDSVTTTLCPNTMPKKLLVQCLQPDRRVEIEIDASGMK